MVLPFFSSLFYFVILAEHPVSRLIYALTKVFTVAWPVAASVWILGKGWKAFSIDLRNLRHWKAFPLGLLTGMCVLGFLAVALATPLGDVVEASSPSIRTKVRQLGIENHYWTFGLFLALLHSFIEEYYWRWFVYGTLAQQFTRWWAHGLAALAFAAHHIVVTTQFFSLAPGVFLGVMVGCGGLIWSLLYEKQKTLTGAWISHVLVDLGVLSIGHKLLFGTWI